MAMRIFMFCLAGAMLFAAPQLRLSTSTVGPLLIVPGTNPAAQTIAASNIGDGTLSLSVASNAAWIVPAISGSNILLTLNTASLAKGPYTGVVTFSAAGAIDSPQTVTVTVLVGGGIPDSFNLFMYPGGSVSTGFYASGNMIASGVAPASMILTVSGSTANGSPAAVWTLRASAPASIPAETIYSGSMVVNLTDFAPDLKTVPVTMNVTALPIVLIVPTLQFNAVRGAAPVTKWIPVRNHGLGSITVNSATSSAPWLSTQVIGTCVASDVPACVVATGDPTGLAPGAYTGTITVDVSPAKNGPFTVAVEMDVVAEGPPVSLFQGVVDNAVYYVNQPVAPGDLVLVRGDQFTLGPAVSATKLPLPATLGGATVYVNGSPAPLYYVAGSHVTYPNGQLTFQIPYGTPPGLATVRVDRNDNGVVQTGNTISVQIASAAPKLMQFGTTSGEYAVATFTDGVTFPIPAMEGIASRPATAGDVLVFYGVGFGQTSPAAVEGVAVAGPAQIGGASVTFGTIATSPSYCGLTPGSVGLYQVNVAVPAGTPKGNTVPVTVSVGGVTSNSVAIAIQ